MQNKKESVSSTKVIKEEVISLMKAGIPERKAISYAGLGQKPSKPLTIKK